MEEDTSENSQKFKKFFDSMSNSNWAVMANEKTIDDLFKNAMDLEEIFNENEKGIKDSLLKSYPFLSLSRFLDVVLENIIKNQHLDEHLTLYAINRYMLLYSKEDMSKFLEKLLTEVEIRSNMFKLFEDFSDIDLDFFKLNKLLSDILNSSDLNSKIENILKTETSSFLSAIKHGEALIAQNLINEIIDCLEAQTDLKLWFTIMKESNLDTVLDLCVRHDNFFQAVFRFFDKFGKEIECNYDEDLDVQYSHVNLDFEDFIKIFQLFLKQEDLKERTAEYLEKKTMSDSNFNFWVDVKACV